jgi:hypothetical protein
MFIDLPATALFDISYLTALMLDQPDEDTAFVGSNG